MEPSASESLLFPFEITAQEFVAFANRDLETDGVHGLVNALSNSKRAIDCQIEAVIEVLGMQKKRSFPKKAESILNLGLLAPRIINRINQLRNYLEHEYKLPSQARVEDAVDTATLFVEVTQRVFRGCQTEFFFGGESVEEPIIAASVEVSFSPSNKIFTISCKNSNETLFDSEITSESEFYVPLLKLTLSSDWNYSDKDHHEIVSEFVSECLSA
ncbi:hypothetical protein ACPV5O_04990 [Vibrio maritimus]|uniref:hypothetical protein n=1 Tax=Vibrio maritimus TaxID=990268 RepID=UPI004067AA49